MNPYNQQPGYGQPVDAAYGWSQQGDYVAPSATSDYQFAMPDGANYLNPAAQPLSDGTAFVPNGSQELVRRNANQQLAPMNTFMWQNGEGSPDEEEDLTRRAQEAKREAEANKKGIPPFVQKLSR
jgi:hypothetical protein